MGKAIKYVGLFWAFIGVLNFLLYEDYNAASDVEITALIMFQMLLFIIPGLILAGIGGNMRGSSGNPCHSCKNPMTADAVYCPNCGAKNR